MILAPFASHRSFVVVVVVVAGVAVVVPIFQVQSIVSKLEVIGEKMKFVYEKV